MLISEFKGIQQYHDGRPVSDYCNMIPLGNSVIDRYGEITVRNPNTSNTVIETFVDSLGNVYIADTKCVRRYRLDEGAVNSQVILSETDGYSPDYKNTGRFVTFAESSTKPSQVFVCDGSHVWYWNTKSYISSVSVDPDYYDRYKAFKAFKLPFTETPVNWTGPHYDETTVGGVPRYIGWYDADDTQAIFVHSITWFDNRLILVQEQKNTVWLSAVDPSRWLTPSYSDGRYSYPEWPWQPQDSESLDVPINTFVPNYYASTASSANTIDAIAFAGQLYFLNDTSIEVWSATGNDQNPIQHNSQNTLYYGGRSPVIINDTLYLICKGAIHNDFIAAIGQNGQITHISNDEIEKLLLPRPYRIRPLAVRDQSMIVVYTDDSYDNGYAVTKNGSWWRYYNAGSEAIIWSVVNIAGVQYGVSRYGKIAMATETNRKYLDNKPILRMIRGGWSQYVGRKILREFELVCDTGIYLDADGNIPGNIFLRVSFDRGDTFGPYLYRKLGPSVRNNKVMIWRNCGSGNSLLLEFGTSDNIRFQIYGLRFELV